MHAHINQSHTGLNKANDIDKIYLSKIKYIYQNNLKFYKISRTYYS